MGARAGIVVCVTSFLLGALFTHWIADSLTLWKSPVTDDHLWTAASYYSILTKGPVESLYFLFSVVFLGAVTILWSFGDGEAGNLMFDGGSIFLFGITVIMYISTVLPDLVFHFSSLPIFALYIDTFPPSLRQPTLELASNNLFCSVALTGVLALQAGRFWAENADSDDEEFVMVESSAEIASMEGSSSSSSSVEGHGSSTGGASASALKGKLASTGSDEKVKPLLQQRVQATRS